MAGDVVSGLIGTAHGAEGRESNLQTLYKLLRCVRRLATHQLSDANRSLNASLSLAHLQLCMMLLCRGRVILRSWWRRLGSAAAVLSDLLSLLAEAGTTRCPNPRAESYFDTRVVKQGLSARCIVYPTVYKYQMRDGCGENPQTLLRQAPPPQPLSTRELSLDRMYQNATWNSDS